MMDHLPADPAFAHEASRMARAFVTDMLNVRLNGGPLPAQDELLIRLNQPDGTEFAATMFAVLANLVGTALVAGATLAAMTSRQFPESENVDDCSEAESELRTKTMLALWAGICADRSIANDGFQ